MIVTARLDNAGQYTGCYCVTDLIDYDPESDTLTVMFAGSVHRTNVSQVRRVAKDYKEHFMSDSQQAAADRIREALLEFRRTKNGADKAAEANPARNRNRYASIDPGTSLAPSPAKPEVVSVPGRDPVRKPTKKPASSPARAASSKRRETKPVEQESPSPASTAASSTRKAQRLSNKLMEIYFPIDSKVTAKIPHGVLDVVETDKAFGKIYRK